MIYFAYDIAMDEGELARPGVAPGAVIAGVGRLLNRRLVFMGEGGRCPVAVPCYGEIVYGVLSFISSPEEVNAVRRLRSPIPRRIARVRTVPANRIVRAVTFEIPPDVTVPEGPAEPEYRDRLIAVARRYEFPEDYIHHIASIPTPEEYIHSGHGMDAS